MQVRNILAAAIATGAMTAASYAKDNAPDVPPHALAAQAEAVDGAAEERTFRSLMQQVLRAGNATETVMARTAASAERQAVEKVEKETPDAPVVTASLEGARVDAPKNAPPFHSIVSRYASEYGVPISLAHAVIQVESSYRPSARGRAGEIGLMQIKPATARGMGYQGSAEGLFDPEKNIKYGMKYLAEAYRLGGGDTCGAILRYNAGHGAKRMNPTSSAYCTKVKRILGGS